jgi:hypothetical protein
VLSFRLFVRLLPSVFARRQAKGAAKLAAEMALIGKAGFGRHVCDRTPWPVEREPFLSVPQPAIKEVGFGAQAEQAAKKPARRTTSARKRG